MATGLLKVRGARKVFAGTVALDDVSMDVTEGTFHALLGGNGSGKSTLIKVLAGVEAADAGELAVGGEEIAADRVSPAWARSAGVRFVHQDLGLFGSLSVVENISLSAGFVARGGLVDWRRSRRHAAELTAALGLEVAPETRVGDLGPVQQTQVAIARALDPSKGPIRLLVLDEPTARLPVEEVETLLDVLRRLTGAGTTVLYVTHRLGEVLDAADAITVLRDGRNVVTRPVGDLDEGDLAELIVGSPLDRVFPEATGPATGERGPVLVARDLAGAAVRGVDLEVHSGEVVGIGGTVGAGRSSLLRLLFGEAAIERGTIHLAERPFAPRTPAEAMEEGVAYVPEDRARDAAFGPLGLTENLSAASMGRYTRLGMIRHRAERLDARRDIAALGVRSSSADAPLRSLSGGNQQKVVLARWLRRQNKLLLLDEPTQGVDVGARAEIYELVRSTAAQGTAVLVASSDFEELVGLCDRIMVMAAGRIVAEAAAVQASADWIAHQTHAATARRVSR